MPTDFAVLEVIAEPTEPLEELDAWLAPSRAEWTADHLRRTAGLAGAHDAPA